MSVGRIFCRGGISGFFQGKLRVFLGEAKNGEIPFFPLETKKTTFFAKNLIGKCQISNSR